MPKLRVLAKKYHHFYLVASRSFSRHKLEKLGIDAFLHGIEEKSKHMNDKEKSSLYAKSSIKLRGAGYNKERDALAKNAVRLHESKLALYSLFDSSQELGDVREAWKTLEAYEKKYGRESKATLSYLKMITSPVNHLRMMGLVPVKTTVNNPLASEGAKIFYVLHNSLPYSSGGYATRAQGVAEGLRESGFEVVGLTRPGYPVDVIPASDHHGIEDEPDDVNGVLYHRIISPKRRDLKAVDYVRVSAIKIQEKIEELQPDIVMAASNYICALPALIAARKTNLPFIYEVRGFWEVSKASREPDYHGSVGYNVQEAMEAFVANSADHVFTLTKAMKAELVGRGVEESRITLLPNCCDTSRFYPMPAEAELKKELGIHSDTAVIGYIGTFVQYEGLDDLAEACSILHERGLDFVLLLVGSEDTSGSGLGPIAQKVMSVAKEGGFSDRLIMPGRVPHQEVERYYSIVDIAPFPRKPLPVCEMVSPMKPLEAMSLEKPVIVSSVSALSEMVIDQHNGLVFDKGNILDLADKLEVLLNDPRRRGEMGRNGREWACAERDWKSVGRIVSETFGKKSELERAG
ncbi:glycosyltransferase [Halomonas alimentaria]|uniref:glycosyltransferase n=1 Tax=Halomonas alimentaria TaxID=147248 RepID=UPI002490A909|nr:glycosyltransferase [Halomonas alimentaria]